jgi:hypothetical protein
MRFSTLVAIVVFLLAVGWVGPLGAKGGKGGGNHGKSGGGSGHVSHAGGSKDSHGGGNVRDSKDRVAQGHKPEKDKDGKDEKVAKDEKSPKEKSSKEKATKDKVAKDKEAKHRDDDEDAQGEDDDSQGEDQDEGGTTTHNKKEKQLANFQRQRDKKLAQAEHLRQIAERNGNANLLANADRMEDQAYQEYARKVMHLERFGVTDPLLDLDGDGFADPWVPGVDPVVDPLDNPLTDPLLEDPVGTLRSPWPFRR